MSTTEIVKAEADVLDVPEREVLTVIERVAKDPASDVNKLERLLDMQERVLRRQAEMAFNSDMLAVQAEMPRIVRDAKNPHTNSTYARLETLNKVLVPLYTRHGFALSFGTANCDIPSHYRLTCRVSHNRGHCQDYQCDLPLDISGPRGSANKSAVQGFGSTLSYGRRYLSLLIFNVSVVGEDDDGQAAAAQKPKGPNALMAEKAEPEGIDVMGLKRKLVDALREFHGTDKGYNLKQDSKARLQQYLWDEGIISDTESLAELTPKRLAEVVARVTKKKPRP